MISIIIPAYNEEKIIEHTLHAMTRGLSDIPHEIIVSDDQSTDRTAELARKYADRVITKEGSYRRTIARNRNQGASVATGDIFVFVDADISIPNHAEFFARINSRFAANQKIVGLSGYVRVLPELASHADRFFYGLLNWFHRIMNNVFHVGRASGEFMAVRAKAFKTIGGFNENLAASEDYDFFGRLSRIGNTRIDPHLIVFQDGRRAHKLGWPRLFWRWFLNATSVMLKNKSSSKEWEPVR